MQGWAKDMNNNKNKPESSKLKKDKKKEKESCRFLFDMIGRLFSR